MATKYGTSLYMAKSLSDATVALTERGRDGAALAGATWIMRAPLRNERQDLAYVGISSVGEIRRIDIFEREICIGACATHEEVATALSNLPECRVLMQAAGNSANPAIRRAATIGGNLCAFAFPASDLVPALMALDASVELSAACGSERLTLQEFLAIRSRLQPGQLVTRLVIQRQHHVRSAHIRLPLRKAGDYPVAIVSMSVSIDPKGLIIESKVAVGSVESVPYRWHLLEASIVGRPLDASLLTGLAERTVPELKGRDGIEAPGWYRVKVLPSLVRRAVSDLQRQS